MTCDDCELSLLDGPPSPDADAHLAGCEKCRAFQKDLEGLAAPEPVSAAERAALQVVPATVQREHQRRVHRKGLFQKVGSLAFAAGLGALVASGVWSRVPRTVEILAPTEPPAAALQHSDLAGLTSVSFELPPEDGSLDEPDFEVAWPSLTSIEGDVL